MTTYPIKPEYNKFITDTATSGTTYELFVLNAGNSTDWAIRKTVVAGGIETVSYALGNGGQAAAWTGRASLTYSQNVALAGRFF
jgi:hypothetical protein